MDSRQWSIRFALTLFSIAAILYALRWLTFDAPGMHNEMTRYLVDDLAFLFIQVPMVTLFVDGLMQRRHREEMMVKLNMVIGAFFTETGTDLLGTIAASDAKLAEVRDDLVPSPQWDTAAYRDARAAFTAHQPVISLTASDLEALRRALVAQKPFFINLLSNQSLLEHESFSDLLWALTHLAEELESRTDLSALPAPDAAHLAGDVKRAYTLLGSEWIGYLRHLQTQYPYLFSLAVRTNPLDPSASVTVSA